MYATTRMIRRKITTGANKPYKEAPIQCGASLATIQLLSLRILTFFACKIFGSFSNFDGAKSLVGVDRLTQRAHKGNNSKSDQHKYTKCNNTHTLYKTS